MISRLQYNNSIHNKLMKLIIPKIKWQIALIYKKNNNQTVCLV